jgi:L-serine dehydratase
MAVNYPDFYNDVFGPIMQPFSSSHTAAPCRIAYLAYCLLGEDVADCLIQLDPTGSFARSLKMMSVDLALLSGCTGHLPHESIMWEIKQYYHKNKIKFAFDFSVIPDATSHSCAKIYLAGKSGKKVWLLGNSIGGGLVETVKVDGYTFSARGDAYMVLLFDPHKNMDGEKAFAALEGDYVLLGKGEVIEPGLGRLYWFETSDPVDADKAKQITGWHSVSVLKPLCPVIKQKDRMPRLFAGFTEWKEAALRQGVGLADLAIEYQIRSSGWSREKVIRYMVDVVETKMRRTTHAVFEEGLMPEDTPFTAHHYRQWDEYVNSGKALMGGVVARALTLAMAAMAPVPGVEFVPAPMGAGGGLLYSSLSAVWEEKGFSHDDFLRGLFVAAGVGAVCFSRTDPGGINIGCAGEQGISSCMAAAAITEMAGGTASQVEAAASCAMQVAVGWPCDPIPGGKNQPCYSRALSAVANAIIFAQLALSGRDALFPLDEVIDAADAVGRAGKTPGCLSGLELCPSGLDCRKRFEAWGREQDAPPERPPLRK